MRFNLVSDKKLKHYKPVDVKLPLLINSPKSASQNRLIMEPKTSRRETYGQKAARIRYEYVQWATNQGQ